MCLRSILAPIGAREVPVERHERDDAYEGWWKVELTVPVDVPEASAFPSNVKLSIYVGPSYPFSDYAVFPEDRLVRDYPHQDSETGKLCLWSDVRIGYAHNRLWNIVVAARDWLGQAARGTLAAPESDYELPDFSRRNHPWLARPRILFDESAESFEKWQRLFGRYGRCDLCPVTEDGRTLAVQSFETSDGRLAHSYTWGTKLSGSAPSCRAVWVLVDDEPIEHMKRPCQTWGELVTFLSRKGVHIQEVFLRHAAGLRPYRELYTLMLLGFPIRQRNCDPPFEIHWQPLSTQHWGKFLEERVDGFRAGHASRKLAYNKLAQPRLFGRKRQVCWGRSTNVHYSRFFGRGKLDAPLVGCHVGLLGAGCIGAHVANCLVREGVTALEIFDSDRVEPGNVCRHTAGIADVDSPKAKVLEKALVATSPHLKAASHEVTLPLDRSSKAWKALASCDLWLDCTGSERTRAWVSAAGAELGKRVVGIYLTYAARHVCMFGSGGDTPAESAHDALANMRGRPDCEIPDTFFEPPGENETFVEGAGCWHPTFPARLHDVLMLVGFAVDRLNERLKSGSERPWAVVAGMDGERSFGSCPSLRCYLESDALG